MPFSPAERIAAEVRAELARQQRTQSELAKALHLSQQAISRRMTGLIPFDVAQLHEIASFLGVPVSRLMPEVAA